MSTSFWCGVEQSGSSFGSENVGLINKTKETPMFYLIYKITNMINGKIYIGKHQTETPNDSYIGSGKSIKHAVKKYGRENFSKEILFSFCSEEEMNAKEKQIITEEFVSRDDTYNMGIGGEGGPHFKGHKHTEESKKLFSRLGKKSKKSPEALKNELQLRKYKNGGNHFSTETIEKIRQKQKARWNRILIEQT